MSDPPTTVKPEVPIDRQHPIRRRMTVLEKGCPMSCQFVPPYLLRNVAERAQNPLASTASEATLAVDDRLRASRDAVPEQVTVTPVVTGVTRQVHDANNTEVLPGVLVRTDGDPISGDIAVDEAFDSSGQVLDLFASQFARQSADGNGSPLSITVHYGRNYDNAFWDGTQLVFESDSEAFNNIYRVNADGTGLTLLVPGEGRWPSG